MVQPAHLRGAVLHDRGADRDLSVAGHGHLVVAADADHGRGVNRLVHCSDPIPKTAGGGATITPSSPCSSFHACSISRAAGGPP